VHLFATTRLDIFRHDEALFQEYLGKLNGEALYRVLSDAQARTLLEGEMPLLLLSPLVRPLLLLLLLLFWCCEKNKYVHIAGTVLRCTALY
jgi:hypothetical protein